MKDLLIDQRMCESADEALVLVAEWLDTDQPRRVGIVQREDGSCFVDMWKPTPAAVTA